MIYVGTHTKYGCVYLQNVIDINSAAFIYNNFVIQH